MDERQTADLRRIGAIAKGVFGEVLAGRYAEMPQELRQATEAQVAASCLGLKPLYFDPYVESGRSLAAAFAGRLPAGVEIRHNDAGIFIYRPEVVEPILNGDPAYYRPNGENTWSAIARVSPEDNGELLGYGARNMRAGDTLVVIHAAGDPSRVYAGFNSRAASADEWARERLLEVAQYSGDALEYRKIPIQCQK
jgi:hypothetical protein